MSERERRRRRDREDRHDPRARKDAMRHERGGASLDQWLLERDDRAIADTALSGVEGPAGDYPFRAQIEGAFGRELTGLRSHRGDRTTEAADALHATAYQVGSEVAFGGEPTLWTAAHEAAHYVQRQGGAQAFGAVSHASDPLELEASAVADRVVRGESAVDLLTGYETGAAAFGGAVLREEKDEDEEHDKAPKNLADMLDGNWEVIGGELYIRVDYLKEIVPEEQHASAEMKIDSGLMVRFLQELVAKKGLYVDDPSRLATAAPHLGLGGPISAFEKVGVAR